MSDGTDPGDRNNVLRLLFNEGSGNIVQDLSGNGNTGIFGTSTSWTAAKFGSGASFPAVEDGTNYITIAAKSSLRTDYISVVTWVYPRGASANGYGGIWFDNLTGDRNRIVIADNGSIYAHFTTAGGDLNMFAATGSIIMNVWSQVVFTWDGVSGRIYVNGILVKTETEAGGVITKSTSDIFIGTSQPFWGELGGIIDNQSVYNHALSASEIASLYREPFSDLGSRRFLPFAPVAVGGISMPVVMLQHNQFNGGMAA